MTSLRSSLELFGRSNSENKIGALRNPISRASETLIDLATLQGNSTTLDYSTCLQTSKDHHLLRIYGGRRHLEPKPVG